MRAAQYPTEEEIAMKIQKWVIGVAAVLVTVSASAHDPKEHEKEAQQAADCAKLNDMDMSKMDPNDPITKALHKKCEAQVHHHHDEANADAAHADHAVHDEHAAKPSSGACTNTGS